MHLQTRELFAVCHSGSWIIILDLVLKCSNPQDHEVRSIILIKQCFIEFEINFHQSISCNCEVQQSASCRRRRSPYKPVRLEQRLSPERLVTVVQDLCSMLLLPKLKCLIWVNNLCMHVLLCWLLAGAVAAAADRISSNLYRRKTTQ